LLRGSETRPRSGAISVIPSRGAKLDNAWTLAVPLTGQAARWLTGGLISTAVIAANFWVQSATGGRAVFLPFYPALMGVGFLSGVLPGLLALLIMTLAADWCWLSPNGSLAISDPTARTGLLVFVLLGGVALVMSGFARQTVMALRRTRSRFSLALAAGQMATWDWNVPTGKIAFSESARSLFGTLWCQTGSVWPITHAEDVDRVRATVERALAQQREYVFVGRMVRPDTRETRWIETYGRVLRSPDGRPVSVTGVSVDVTDKESALEERRRTEEALRRSEEELRLESRRKDEFLAILAHELRNPLAPARFATQLLEKSPPESPQAEKARRMIERQLAHMARLLDDLLDVSRISRKAVEIRRDSLDLRSVIETAVDTARPLAAAVDVHLQLRQPEYPLPVSGDAARLNQVLANLLNNAIKYTDPQGHIHVESVRSNGHVTICVEDDGIGIAPELLPRIFELFTQGRSSSRGSSGLGIGLTVAREIVILHGGRLNAASAGVGLGSRFTIELPCAQEVPALLEPITAPEKIAVLGASSTRVLVVDDNVDAADALALVLSTAGYQTKVAYEGTSALELAELLRPSVVFLDIGLPNLSGHEIARRVRSEPWGLSVRLVAITGWGHENDRKRSREAGFDEHLTKPVDPRRLLQLMAGWSQRESA
jgi:signal transduction histidine kinase/ActR/RegA family two-component response regulator